MASRARGRSPASVWESRTSTTKEASRTVEPTLRSSQIPLTSRPDHEIRSTIAFPGRHPPPKHHPTRARHGDQVAVPGGHGRVTGHRAVGAMAVDELSQGTHRLTPT